MNDQISILRIPFRVVVEILSFHQVELGTDSKSTDLFGVFRNEVTRKVFFIFSSISLSSGTSVIMDMTKIQSLSVVNPSPRFFEALNKNSQTMIRLHELVIKDVPSGKSAYNDYSRLFSKESSFPFLRRFKMLYKRNSFFRAPLDESVKLKLNKWYQNDVWKRLESFFFDVDDKIISSFLENENIFNNLDNWKRLKRFQIRGIEKPMNISLPSVRSLNVGSRNLVNFLCVKNLSSLEFTGIQNVERMQKLVIASSRTLTELSFSSIRDIREPSYVGKIDWFFDFEFPNLEKLKVHGVGLCVGFSSFNLDGTITPRKEMHFPSNIRELDLNFDDFDMIQFNCSLLDYKHYKDLKRVSLNGRRVFEAGNDEQIIWPWSNTLESLSIEGGHNAVDEMLLGCNSWENLKELHLHEYCYFNSKGTHDWFGRMTRLEVLNLQNLEDGINDGLCSKIGQFCMNLKELRVVSDGGKELTGSGWGFTKLKHLHTLELKYLSFLEDTLFQENEFKRLEKLVIEGSCNKMLGKNWNKMSNLKYLKLDFLQNITDHFFQQETQLFGGLEVLDIRDCFGVVGKKGWKIFPCLLVLRINLCLERIRRQFGRMGGFEEFEKRFDEYYGEEFWKNKCFCNKTKVVFNKKLK